MPIGMEEEVELPNFDKIPQRDIKEYLVEFCDNGNTDGFDELELKVIKRFLDDIVLYSKER
jgi:hypothetical protein